MQSARKVRPKKSAKHFHPSAYVESFVYDVFLALNLALPGSCDFYLSTVTSNLEKFPDKVELSHHWFELSYANTYEGKWPASIQLPLPAVRDWLQQIRSGLAQVPNNQMEKVLFALWHICAASDISPPTVVWLFYALETLFDTQPGENLRALQRRISAMLSATEKDLKILKKELRVLYDLRSSFVHGGLEVIHPMHGTLLDPRADERYWRVAKPCEFGFSVLLRSLQEVIARKWYSVHYKEETIAGDAPANT